MLYLQLKNTVQPQGAQDWPAELAAFEKMIPEAVAAANPAQGGAEVVVTGRLDGGGFHAERVVKGEADLAVQAELGHAGADVIVNYVRDEDQAQAIVEEVKRCGDNRAHAYRADVSKEDEVREMFAPIVGADPSQVWIGGSSGELLKWAGSSWTRVTAGIIDHLAHGRARRPLHAG